MQDSLMNSSMNEDEFSPKPAPWKCPLCSAENRKGEEICRFCRLPAVNQCVRCKRIVGKSDHFCKYCGSATVYFQASVFDPNERKLAAKECRQTFAYWREKGVQYMNMEEEYDYSLQVRAFGEVVD